MRTIYYYRREDTDIRDAKARDNAESLTLEQTAQAFAALFGAVPVFTTGSPTPSMAGITWVKPNRPKNPLLWTQPTKNDLRQFPLPKRPKAKNLWEAYDALVKQWNDTFPVDATKPRTSHLLAALGLSESLIVGNAMQYFFGKDGVSWVATSLPLDESKFTEVKGSEFAAAKDAWDLWQEELHQMPTLQMTPVAPVPEAAND